LKYTTPETLIADVNKILSDAQTTANDIVAIEMDENALKFFTKFWLTRHKSDYEVEAQLNHQKYNIGDLVGSYRGVKVFCGVPGSVLFYDKFGADVARVFVKGFEVVDVDSVKVFEKLKDVLGLGSDADELDVLVEVVRLVEDQPAPVNINWPTTIGDPIPAPTVQPWTQPTITWASDSLKIDDDRIPQHLQERYAKVMAVKAEKEDMYDARN
jgi:hypothetical protein